MHFDIGTYLENELETRCRANPRYSLRSFARDLQVDPSNLSKLIAGKHKTRRTTQSKILMKLGLDPQQISSLIHSSETLTKINHSDFSLVAEWHYDAILELTRVDGFKADFKWIAKTLEISETMAKIAVDRLIKLGFLEIDQNGKWHDRMGNVTTSLSPEVNADAQRNRQIALLERSKEAAQRLDKKHRDHSSTTMAIQKSDLPEVVVLIQEFRQKLAQFLERPNVKPDSVYQLQVSFFPLTGVDPNSYTNRSDSGLN